MMTKGVRLVLLTGMLLLGSAWPRQLMAQGTAECELVSFKRVDQTFASQEEAKEWIKNNGEKFASDLCRAKNCPDSRCELVDVRNIVGAGRNGRFDVTVYPTCRCLKGIDEGCKKIEMIGRSVDVGAFHGNCDQAEKAAEGLALLIANRVCSYGLCKGIGEECIARLKIEKDDIHCETNLAGCNCFIKLTGDMIKCKCAG